LDNKIFFVRKKSTVFLSMSERIVRGRMEIGPKMPALVTIFLTLICTPCFAGVIVDNLPPSCPGCGAGGFWTGTDEQNGVSLNNLIAQTFQTDAAYSEVTAEVILFGSVTPGYELPVISFYIAADDNGAPGSPLATVDVTITDYVNDDVYALPFQNLDLLGGVNYWLVASSSAWFTFNDGGPGVGTEAGWIVSLGPSEAAYVSPLATSLDSGPWAIYDESLAFAVFGTQEGPVVGYPPPLVSSETELTAVPEPSSAAPLGIVLMVLAGCGKRRRRTAP
jgi:hypothetical protein